MTSDQRISRIFKNTFYLFSGDTLSRLLTWAQIAYLTRAWTEVATYGQYALVINWIAIFMIFSEMGLNALAVREVARRRESAVFYLRNVMILRGSFSIFFWILLISVSFIFNYELVVKTAMAILGLRVLLDSIAGGYVYLLQSHQKMGLYSLTTVISAIVRFVGIFLIVRAGGGVVEACWMWVLSSAISLFLLMVIGFREKWKPNFLQFNLKDVLIVLKKSLPLAAFGTFQVLYYRVDEVILKNLLGNEAVGYYDLATRILLVVLATSQQYATAVFPVFSSLQDDATAFGRLAARSLKILGLLSVPITVGGCLLAKPIIQLISGSKYTLAGPLFAVLILSVIPFFVSNVFVGVLAVKNTFRLNLQFLLLFILNVVLNLVLIPIIGVSGAAWATVLCEFMGIGLGFWLARPYIAYPSDMNFIRPVVGCLLASGLMGTGIWLDPRLYWLVLGPAVYGVGLYLFSALEHEEWNSLFAFLKKSLI